MNDIKSSGEYKIDKPSGDDNTATLNIDGELITIGSMATPIPLSDIEGTPKYSYNWENAIEEIKEHKGHLATDNTLC